MRGATHARKASIRHRHSIFGFALLALWFGATTTAGASRMAETNSEPDTQQDGLQQVPVDGAGAFWIRPSVDLRNYNRVAIRPLQIEYKATPRYYRLDQIDRMSSGVLLTERELERLQETFYDAFKIGLARGRGFGPASSANPGLLWVSASLMDVVVRYKTEPLGSEVSAVADYGEMTLRVDFSDSQTGDTVARFEEHRRIRPWSGFMGDMFLRHHFPYWSALRANLERWSELVRRRMYQQRAQAMRLPASCPRAMFTNSMPRCNPRSRRASKRTSGMRRRLGGWMWRVSRIDRF